MMRHEARQHPQRGGKRKREVWSKPRNQDTMNDLEADLSLPKIVSSQSTSSSWCQNSDPFFSQVTSQPENGSEEAVVSKTPGSLADEWLSENREWVETNHFFLSKLRQVMKAEAIATDVASLGSLFTNWTDALYSGRCNFDHFSYLISASTGRIHNVNSNCMQYTKSEYQFWEHFHASHSSHPIRDLTGWKYWGAEDGQKKSVIPDELKINIAVPSLSAILANSVCRPKGIVPGIIPEALEAAKQSKMREVNLGLDEKFLSTGIEVNVDPSTLEVTVKGDVHLFPEEQNKDKTADIAQLQLAIKVAKEIIQAGLATNFFLH
jgi:transposase-like protein